MLQRLVKLTQQSGGNARAIGLVLTIALGVGSPICHAEIINGGFSIPNNATSKVTKTGDKGRIKFYPASAVTGWTTTDSEIEIWSDGATPEKMTFRAPKGFTQFAEINANQSGTLSQTVSDIGVGNKFGFSFYHRGRESATKADVLKVRVVDTKSKAVLLDKDFSTTNADWKRYTVDLGVKKDNSPLLLSFTAVSAAGGISIGNFLTGVELGETYMLPTPLSTFSEWQVQPGPGSFTPLPQGYTAGKINNAVAFKAAKIPAPSTGWATIGLDKNGRLNYEKPSRFADCNTKLDFTYFQTTVTISDVSKVQDISVHFGAVDDYARVYVNDQFDEKNDVKPPAKKGDFVLPAGYLRNGPNRIVIALLDDCRAFNFLKDTGITIRPKP